MSLALLSRHPFELAHVGRVDGLADDGEVVDLGDLAALLVVLHEDHQVLHVLELDETQRDGATVQLARLQSETKRSQLK